jgi:hypothetical protein
MNMNGINQNARRLHLADVCLDSGRPFFLNFVDRVVLLWRGGIAEDKVSHGWIGLVACGLCPKSAEVIA